MMELWEEAFREYIEIVQTRLAGRNLKDVSIQKLRIVKNTSLIRDEVEKIEQERGFQNLVETTYTSLYKKEGMDMRNLLAHDIKNFFRRSGYYLDTLEGKSSNIDSLVTAYYDASQKTERQVRYLAPIEYVQFGKSSMDFGTFRIQKFTRAELSSILQNRINQVFFPWAVLDVDQLAAYWFINMTVTEFGGPSALVFDRHIDWTDFNRVSMQ
jgi:hypothetical protein